MMRPFLTTAELSEFIGRSPAAIRNLVLRRTIPFRKPAGRLLFVRNEIEDWINGSPGISLKDIEETENGR